MKSILVLYYSRGGHTARISRCIVRRIQQQGYRCEMMGLLEAEKEGIDWQEWDAVVLGACVLYGTYDKSVFAFCSKYQQQLDQKAISFFSVNVVARKPEKRIPENNRYLQKFIELSAWKPNDVKIIAGKVDYPSWRWLDKQMIRLIMKITDGPTDTKAVIDYTDYQEVDGYADHLATLVPAN
ncbi:menaquinone-dependent protoporphyrinogen IX dehydrogenase [Shewanella yunxiaonensis]|uniref:Protoporphyrinogen IX dehydrogenase [quinone] n=1 Tax=Shewanella yunxiaonensis TaxID=2829809 RepID=A0ABX7YT96_9GAMM|nr:MULTISPECIES: menaquinone-dependent protoporphyrinogen IX dehydrogenase [Shewanella]MDF0535364.1 menaquinone-dependent protoporphyrinogen IX dehydrogenase [Shewanella sp. A32]QUN05937.1 menaquinone-dependent protoporphyrinogen IX dehydrogenase [Shewanella yunxiaonensis]